MEGSVFRSFIISRWTVMLIIQFWCKDGHYIWQVQGNVPEIYMQSLCKLRYSSRHVYFSASDLYCYSTSKTYLSSSIKSPVIFLGYFAITSHAFTSRQPCLFIVRLNNHVCSVESQSFFIEDFFLNIFSIRKNELVENNLVNFSYSQTFTLWYTRVYDKHMIL